MDDFDSNGGPWAEYAAEITAIYIEEGVTFIGGYAFMDCVQVTDIVLPDTVTEIGYCVFSGCTGLTSINIPEGVTVLHDSLFSLCTSLAAIDIPDSVTRLEGYVFSSCTALTSLEIPDSVTYIGQNCFSNCTALTEIVIPDSVTTMEAYAFCECTALERVKLSNQLTKLDEHCFSGCTSLKEIVIPASITNIGGWAFSTCGTIDSVTFMKNAPKIAVTAFMETTATCYYPAGNDTWTEDKLAQYDGTLTWVPYEPTIVTDGECGENVTWHYDQETATLTISGTGPMADYSTRDIPYWMAEEYPIQKVVVESGVTHIGNHAFNTLQTLEEIVLPETLESIGSMVFVMCENLTAVTIPEGVTTIGEFAFSQCRGLTEVSLPSTLTFMDWYAFEKCGSLTEVIVPGSLSSIADGAFIGCSSLQKLTLENGISSIGYSAFESCAELESVTIPASVTAIYSGAFAQCYALTEIHFEGDAPTTDGTVFGESVATAYYPMGNSTWTEDVMQTYGGTLTWVAENGKFDRISGSGRCETAIEVAEMMMETLGIEKFDAIIIANGDNFADALAGSYLAAQKNAPILLYRASAVELNLAYIQENLSEDGVVYLLGGASAVPTEVEEGIAAAGIQVERLAGGTRFDTNLEILKEAGLTAGQEILVATGYNFADSLSASATGLPILLVNNGAGVLTDAQIEFLASLEGCKFTIVGGNSAVSDDLMNQIAQYGDVTRLAGTTREATSVLVAETYFEAPDRVILAYSRNFPDGLCGGPLAYVMGAPLILTNAGQEAPAAAYVADNGIENALVLGGASALTDETIGAVLN